MTTGALLFLVGVAAGLLFQTVWSVAVELFDIYRENNEG